MRNRQKQTKQSRYVSGVRLPTPKPATPAVAVSVGTGGGGAGPTGNTFPWDEGNETLNYNPSQPRDDDGKWVEYAGAADRLVRSHKGRTTYPSEVPATVGWRDGNPIDNPARASAMDEYGTFRAAKTARDVLSIRVPEDPADPKKGLAKALSLYSSSDKSVEFDLTGSRAARAASSDPEAGPVLAAATERMESLRKTAIIRAAKHVEGTTKHLPDGPVNPPGTTAVHAANGVRVSRAELSGEATAVYEAALPKLERHTLPDGSLLVVPRGEAGKVWRKLADAGITPRSKLKDDAAEAWEAGAGEVEYGSAELGKSARYRRLTRSLWVARNRSGDTTLVPADKLPRLKVVEPEDWYE